MLKASRKARALTAALAVVVALGVFAASAAARARQLLRRGAAVTAQPGTVHDAEERRREGDARPDRSGPACSRPAAAPSTGPNSTRLVERAAKSGIELLPFIAGAPTWAVPSVNVPGSPGTKAPARPAGRRHRRHRLVVVRSKPRSLATAAGGTFWAENPTVPAQPVKAWQIWNEPNFKYFVAQPEPDRIRQAREALLHGDQVGRPERPGDPRRPLRQAGRGAAPERQEGRARDQPELLRLLLPRTDVQDEPGDQVELPGRRPAPLRGPLPAAAAGDRRTPRRDDREPATRPRASGSPSSAGAPNRRRARPTSSPSAPSGQARELKGAFTLLKADAAEIQPPARLLVLGRRRAGNLQLLQRLGPLQEGLRAEEVLDRIHEVHRRTLRRYGGANPSVCVRSMGWRPESKQPTNLTRWRRSRRPTRRWFEASFEGPTPAQAGGWEAISGGANALICAPTGSGKTLASFLWGIDKLAREPELGTGVKLVYISPLKALSYDIERNLRAPLRGIGAEIAVGLRTGDTSQKDRRAMAKTPPDILITTPESLYLMMCSAVREILTGVEAVIVDEIHAVAQTKRGCAPGADPGAAGPLVRTSREEAGEESPPGIQRIGLSATQRPLERIAQFLVGPKRECKIVDAGTRKELDLEIVVPVDDMSDPGAPAYPLRGRHRAALGNRAERPRALDLAGDLPEAAGAGPGTHLDDHLRQQPARLRAPRQAAERARQRRRRGGAAGDRARRPRRGGAESATRTPASRWSTSKSPAPTTARSRTRSGRSSRSC